MIKRNTTPRATPRRSRRISSQRTIPRLRRGVARAQLAGTGVIPLLSLLTLLCGCSATIIPPPPPADPVAIAVTDYGRHSSIVLPDGDGTGSVEYTFGDWDWFAAGHNGPSDAVQAMLWSKGSTLGRRHVDLPPDARWLGAALLADRVFVIEVPRDRAAALRDELGAKFARRANQALYNQVMELHFIPDDEPYGLMHNCNHVTARWLREMGCATHGNAVTSKFKLAPAAEVH
jgi:hypothetical protein